MSEAEPDAIVIEELELNTRIGVPEEERSAVQRLTVSITMCPRRRFGELKDEIANAVDYSSVTRNVEQFAAARSDKLIETLADAIASHLLVAYPLRRVRVELRKFVLRETKFVAAVCERRA